MKKNIGKIVNTHGIRGDLRILSNSDFKDSRFQIGNKLEVSGHRVSEIVEIEKWYVHKNFDILKFKGYDNINDVEKFKNGLLLGDSLDQSVLAEGEFFLEDIIGLKVVDEAGSEIGIIKDINLNSYQRLLIIDGPRKGMVPYVDEFVLNTDLATKTMTIKLIPGLLDEN